MSGPTCALCATELVSLTVPLRLVWEGRGHDEQVTALICPADDRHPGLIDGRRPQRLATGALRRLAYWGEQDRQTRAKGLVRL